MTRQLRRREFLLSGLGVAGFGLLAACGGGGDTATSVTGGMPSLSSGAKKSGGELRYLLRGSSPNETKATQEFFDNSFVRQTGVKVKVEPASGEVDEKLTGAMGGGNAQDVFDTWLDNVVPSADRTQIVDVAPLVGRDLQAVDIADFYPWQWKSFKLPNGIRFGMPKFVNIEHYPELAEVNLDLAPKAMQEGYLGHRPLFKKDGEAQQILTPALEKLFAGGDPPVTYMKDVA